MNCNDGWTVATRNIPITKEYIKEFSVILCVAYYNLYGVFTFRKTDTAGTQGQY